MSYWFSDSDIWIRMSGLNGVIPDDGWLVERVIPDDGWLVEIEAIVAAD